MRPTRDGRYDSRSRRCASATRSAVFFTNVLVLTHSLDSGRRPRFEKDRLRIFTHRTQRRHVRDGSIRSSSRGRATAPPCCYACADSCTAHKCCRRCLLRRIDHQLALNSSELLQCLSCSVPCPFPLSAPGRSCARQLAHDSNHPITHHQTVDIGVAQFRYIAFLDA